MDIYFLIITLAVTVVASSAQDRSAKKERIHWSKKIERKTYLSSSFGLGIFTGADEINRYGQSSNLYAGLTPGLGIGGGIWYKFSPNLHFGPEMSYMYAGKPNYLLNLIALNLGAKFYPLKSGKKFSPYITGGLQFTMANINQQAHKRAFSPDETQSLDNFGVIVQYETRYQNINVLAGPLMGPYIGAGIDYAINKKYKLFLQANFQPTLNDNAKISENFDFNKSFLQYTAIRGGITIQLFKPKPPEIDTNIVPIPDPLYVLQVPEEILERGMLIREGTFDVIVREGVKHVVRISTTGPEVIIEETVQDPCKVMCYLVDEKGNIISKAESTPEGKIVFSDVDKGIYDVIFVLEKPCKEANFTYKFPDPHTHPLMEYNEDGTIIDSITYQINGSVLLPDSADFSFVYKSSAVFLGESANANTNKNFDIKVYLTDLDRRVIRYYEPIKNEQFSFKKLKSPSHEVIYKVPDAEQKSGITYSIADQHKYILKRVTYENFSDSTSKLASGEEVLFDNMKYVMKGNVTLLDSVTTYNEVVVYLVNNKKRIVNSKRPEKNGSFVFKNLKAKNEYSVYYELQYSLGKAKIDYHYEEPVFVARNANQYASSVPISTMPDFPVYEAGTTYSPTGKTLNPEGYCVQVGAFENVANVEALCQKLRADGFKDISIQVFMTEWLNKRYGFSRNFKLHRIVVGEYSKEKEAIRAKDMLNYLGYDSYVVKHFEKK
ncbi:MAG: SPOR domain-containing protein [Cytophagales bacterium]|nr:SPOR domain-containing protein [Cytophagales bacterium]